MPTRSLPSRPSLEQLKRQARELRREHGRRKLSAAARIVAHHPRLAGRPLQAVLDERLGLADAQLVLAREYGFAGWARLKHHVEIERRLAALEPHPRFGEAVAALERGDLERLRALLVAFPGLVQARTNLEPPYDYFSGATLLHHVAWNPGRDAPPPDDLAAAARLLLVSGADVDATTLGPDGGTTMGLLVTSKEASDAGISGPLMDVLLEHGARLDLEDLRVLDAALANHAPRAAEKMLALGARPDVLSAAALGRMDLLRAAFDDGGGLRSRPRRDGRIVRERDAVGLALLYAYVGGRLDAVDLLLAKDGNWNVTGAGNGTVLHRAAWAGDLVMVQRLVARGADTSDRKNPFNATPLSWARHNAQHAVFRWMRQHCPIDLHDAVCFDLREHLEARLLEDPRSVNRRIDQWEIPASTPLHWAAWRAREEVDGWHRRDPSAGQRLAQLLIERGADPNVVAGNGLTALDIALAGGCAGVAILLERHGGKRAAEL